MIPESPPRTAKLTRLDWRAVVLGSKAAGDNHTLTHVAWHLLLCPAPSRLDSHCAEGQRLLKAQGDPDGHCLVDGICPRCADNADL